MEWIFMAIRTVLRMGHPILRQSAKEVKKEELQDEQFKSLTLDLIETMRAYRGIGIAAPQIGHSIQMCIIEIPKENKRYQEACATPLQIIINPKISILDPTLQGIWEGCLSVPGLRGLVERPRKIQVDYMDEFGLQKSIVAEDFLSTVYQHELDHLFGKLYIDRLKDPTQFSFEEEYEHYYINQNKPMNLA